MSKSGSKALSKSVDSVVKSVESVVSSVVPKNINMKHVLLAILVGLLLCMLMGNTVEGYTCTAPDPSALGAGVTISDGSNPGAPIGTAGNDAPSATDFTTEAAKYTCASGTSTVTCGAPGPYVVSCTGGDTACTTESGPYQSDGNICGAYCDVPPLTANPGTIDASSGVCSSDFNLPVQKNLCATNSEQNGCESTQGCNWRLFSGDDSMFSDQKLSDPLHLRGLFNTLMNLAGFSNNGCPASAINLSGAGETDAMTTTTLPLITDAGVSPTSLGAEAETKYPDWLKLKGGTDGADVYKDFFSLMFDPAVVDPPRAAPGSKPKMSTLINASTNLPADLKDHLYNIVLGEEKLWDEVEKLDSGKTLFNKNGGRLIAGYNETSGFVIRNSASQPTLLPGSKTRVHVGAGCPGSWNVTDWDNSVSCKSTSQCISDVERSQAIKAEKVTKIGDFVIPYGDSIIRNYCKLDKCASKFPECQLDNLINKVTTAGLGNLGALI
jgi:hypothetical protein